MNSQLSISQLNELFQTHEPAPDPNLSRFASITSVGASLEASGPEITETLANGDFVVGIAVYEGLPSAMITLGRSADLNPSVGDDGKLRSANGWRHVTALIGPEAAGPGHFSAGGDYTPLNDARDPAKLSDDTIMISDRPTTNTSERRRILYPTVAHGPAQTGSKMGYASLKTTRIVTREQLPELLQAVADVVGLKPEAAGRYEEEMAFSLYLLDNGLERLSLARAASAVVALETSTDAPAVPPQEAKQAKGTRLDRLVARSRRFTTGFSLAHARLFTNVD